MKGLGMQLHEKTLGPISSVSAGEKKRAIQKDKQTKNQQLEGHIWSHQWPHTVY